MMQCAQWALFQENRACPKSLVIIRWWHCTKYGAILIAAALAFGALVMVD
jgi:hypothetical protein